MKKSRYFKVVVAVVLVAFIIQAGFITYSMIQKQSNNILIAKELSTGSTSLSSPTTIPPPVPATVDYKSADVSTTAADTVNITVPADVLDLIKKADSANYDRNVANYKELLVKLNVHEKYKNEIENMIRNGKKLPDILIAYSYVNERYGKLDEVKALVNARSTGKGWLSLFEEYNINNPDFMPQSFDPVYLEELMKTDGITKDDVMITDRVSQKLSIPFKDSIQKRIGKMSWKDINAEYGIVNGQAELPHVPVTPDKVKKLMQSNGLSEQNVMQAYIIAYKLNLNVETITTKMKLGYSKVRILAECLENKYN